MIGVRRPAGTDLAESTRINSVMEKILLARVSRRGVAHLEPQRCAGGGHRCRRRADD